MPLPFTADQFFEVFRRYNEAVWPAQWLFNVLAIVALTMAVMHYRRNSRGVPAILAVFWMWMGAVYHLAFFAKVNPTAYVFGALFLVQALLFAWLAWRARLTFAPRSDAAGIAGWLLILYALILYPAVGLLLGHTYPASPTFGLPCPTTLFTLGVLLWARPPVPWGVLVIPMLWTIAGSVAALQLGVWEDLGLAVAAAAVAGRSLARHGYGRPLVARRAMR
jgi:hypothetical protein